MDRTTSPIWNSFRNLFSPIQENPEITRLKGLISTYTEYITILNDGRSRLRNRINQNLTLPILYQQDIARMNIEIGRIEREIGRLEREIFNWRSAISNIEHSSQSSSGSSRSSLSGGRNSSGSWSVFGKKRRKKKRLSHKKRRRSVRL